MDPGRGSLRLRPPHGLQENRHCYLHQLCRSGVYAERHSREPWLRGRLPDQETVFRPARLTPPVEVRTLPCSRTSAFGIGCGNCHSTCWPDRPYSLLSACLFPYRESIGGGDLDTRWCWRCTCRSGCRSARGRCVTSTERLRRVAKNACSLPPYHHERSSSVAGASGCRITP